MRTQQVLAHLGLWPRKMVLVAVLALIGLPVVLVLIEAVSFCVLNRNDGTIVASGQQRELEGRAGAE